MTSRISRSGQPEAMADRHEAIGGREYTRAHTIWKIVATVVTALFIMLLLLVDSRLVWLGAG